MIIGILGFRRTGKDTVANLLTEIARVQKIGFADNLKRVCRQVFDFTDDQLWGTQEQKETPDQRYPRKHNWDRRMTGEDPVCLCCSATWKDYLEKRTKCFLTPRFAMQRLGTEGARWCWDDIWVKKALEDAKAIHEHGRLYEQRKGLMLITSGLTKKDYGRNAVFIDNRFVNETQGIQAAGGSVYRIKRPGYERPAFNHPSETEQLRIPDDRLQGVIWNDGTLEDLKAKIRDIIGKHLQP